MFTEPLTKVAKKNDDIEEPVEEEKANEVPPEAESGDCGTGSDCSGGKGENTPKEESPENGSVEPKAEAKEEEANHSKEEKKEEESAQPNETDTATATAPADVNSEEAESPATTGDPPATDASPTATDGTSTDASGLPPGVPSGLPNTPVDPTEPATFTNPDSVVEERAELDKELVGRVIGKGGEMIRDLQVSIMLCESPVTTVSFTDSPNLILRLVLAAASM